MKKCAWVLAILMLMALSVDAYAAPSFGLGARAGGMVYKDGGMDVSLAGFGKIGRVDYSYDKAFTLGVNGTLKLIENFGVEVAADRTFKSQCDFKNGDVSLKAGDLSQTSITATARIYFPFLIFSPYVGAGAGYYFRSYDKDNAFWNPATNVDVDNGLGYHVNAGTEIFLNPGRNLAVDIDLKYIWTKADLKASNAGASITGSMDFNAFTAGVGIKYYF